MTARIYKSPLYKGALSSLWISIRLFFSPSSTLASRHISLTRSVERAFGAGTRLVQSLYIYPRAVPKPRRADMTALTTVFSVFVGIRLVLSVVPLYWHLKARNVGTCMYMIWTALSCFVQFVDTIVWNGNAINWAPAWCEFGAYTRPFAQFLSLTD
jgi:hypothetical protein